MKMLRLLVTSIGLLATVACTVIDHAPRRVLDNDAKWALLPMANFTETPQAGARMTEMAGSLLASAGVADLIRYMPSEMEDPLIGGNSNAERAQAMEWAKQQGARYAVTGAVTEWRYKTGVEGEPAVGISFQIIDVHTQKSLWSGAGAKTGWSRESVSGVALKMTRQLMREAGL